MSRPQLLSIARYAGIAYLGAVISYVVPFESRIHQLVSTGAQAFCIILGLDY